MEGRSALETEARSDSDPSSDPDTRPGISLRAITELFDQIKKHEAQHRDRRFRVYCSFLQIYNERIYDLLNPNSIEGRGLRLRWNKEDQFVVENLFTYEVQSSDEAIEIYTYGTTNRVTTSHRLNMFSSRSHSIFCLNVETIDTETQEQVASSKLQLVDLAGSERTAATGNSGDERHFKESIDINKSLFTLGKVIAQLASAGKSREQAFVPYRDSKLTSLLKQSLGGNSFCVMVSLHIHTPLMIGSMHRPTRRLL